VIFVVLDRLGRKWGTGHAILFAYPLAEIKKLAAFGTKRPKRIILPFDLFVAGGTFHLVHTARELTD
jgi:hypothetical protein